jgi:small subunit ribosomal protein S10
MSTYTEKQEGKKIQKSKEYVKVSLYSMDSRLLDSVVKKIIDVAKTNLITAKAFALPTKKTLFNILKSPFIYKTTRDQFHLVRMKRVIYLYLKSNQSIDIFKNVMIPAGVDLVI